MRLSHSNRIERRVHARGHAAGFTLLELMIVITIILILLSLGASKYQQSLMRSREAVLKQDLFVMRQAIDSYTRDRKAAPQSLDELVTAGYLRKIPVDPMTGRADWRVEFEREPVSADQSTGIENVRSNSESTSPFEGTRYSEW